MKNIYELNNKEIKKELRNFGSTIYGKTVFFIAFAIPMILMISCIATFILWLINTVCYSYLIVLAMLVVLETISFIIGNMYYYHELRVFVNYKNEHK